MAIMMYITDVSGAELAMGVFGGNGSSPKINGNFDHSRRMHCHFCGGPNLTATDFGLDLIKVKIWGPGEGPGKRSVDYFMVGTA